MCSNEKGVSNTLPLKFNLSFCSNLEDLQKSHRNILRNASFKLRDNIITAVSKRIEDLVIVRNEHFYALKGNVPNESFIDICERIKKEIKSLSASIVRRQNSKYQRDNISDIDHHQQNRKCDAQNAEITTGKGKQYTKQTKN